MVRKIKKSTSIWPQNSTTKVTLLKIVTFHYFEVFDKYSMKRFCSMLL